MFDRDNLEIFPNYLIKKLGFKRSDKSNKAIKEHKKKHQEPKPTKLDTSKAKSYPLDKLLERDGFQLNRSSSYYYIKCPFHADERCSAVFYPSTNLIYCFKCGTTYNPIDYLILVKGYQFKDAMKELT